MEAIQPDHRAPREGRKQSSVIVIFNEMLFEVQRNPVSFKKQGITKHASIILRSAGKEVERSCPVSGGSPRLVVLI